MTANELRVGNYFQWIKIASMGIGKDVITKDNHYTYEGFKEPIPLTEEWLVKFGFELGNDEWYDLVIPNGLFLSVEQYTFNVVIGQVVQFSHALTKLKSVHQLQNLYHALTGEDLTITK